MKSRTIKRIIDLRLLAFLRQEKLVMAYCNEVKYYTSTFNIVNFGIERIGLHIFPWETSIQGYRFWERVEKKYQHFQHPVKQQIPDRRHTGYTLNMK